VTPSYVHHERVRFGDLDANRHLNNVVFLRYYETARIAFIRTLLPEHDPAAPEATGLGLIFAECTIRYRSPVQFDEEVAIRCAIGEVRRSAFEIPFEMHAGDRLVAEGSGWLVGYDYEHERAAPLHDGLRAALQGDAAADRA
jgi:acyl-CoA thioester hydrolase